MTEAERIDEVIDRIEEAESGTGPMQECPDGFWTRLLRSLRISVKPGTSFKQPIREVTITGGADL